MTRKTKAAAVALTGVAISLTACGDGIVEHETSGDRGGDSVTLELASYMAENHPYSQWYLAWAEEVTDRTDGRISFKNYWSSSLLESADLAPGASDGRVDLAHTSTSYNPHMFPLSELLSVPFATEQIGAAVEATTTLYDEGGAYFDEFDNDNLVPLHFQPAGTNVLGTTKPVENLNDLESLQIRSGSYYTDVTSTARANPISMPLSDVYQSMQTGLLDAWMTPLENAVQFNVAEVTPHMQDTGMGSFGLVVIVMNRDTFDSLSEQDQQVLLETSADYNRRFIEDMLIPMDAASCTAVQEAGAEVTEWSERAVEDARSTVAQPMLDAYLADMESSGVPGEEFVQRWNEFQESYDGDYGEYPGSIRTCLAN